MFPLPNLILATFECPNFSCPDCGYIGPVELKTSIFGKTPGVFRLGDLVQEGHAGRKEYFDGVFCPECFKKNSLKVHGVVLEIKDGVFANAYF